MPAGWAARKGGDVAIGAPELRLLDAEGLRALESADVEIGVHGSTQRPLTSLSGRPAELAHETSGATATFARVQPPRTFAYPHGKHDAVSRAAVAEAGLQAAFTVTPGRVGPGGDRYQLPRIEVLRRDGAGGRLLLKVALAGRLPELDGRGLLRRAHRRADAVRRRLGS